MKSQSFLENSSAGIRSCPYCRESLTRNSIHICPAECCYVDPGMASRATVCPYCENDFETGRGHVCLELIALTEPAQ